MTNPEPDNGMTHDDLLQRVALMETMIAEGRGFTTRHGWIFLLWGLVDLVAWTWQNLLPHSDFAGKWAWPICLVAGAVITVVGKVLQTRKQGWSRNAKCRSVEAVWAMMGVALAIYISVAIIRHLTDQYSYVAAILMLVGLAHAISAVILRWRAQAVVAGIWWAGGVAALAAWSWKEVSVIMLVETCLGMIAFGLYAMLLERRNGGEWVKRNV
jgi:hypothetical protein